MLRTLWSPSKKYRIDIYHEGTDCAGDKYYTACIMEVIRNYFQPILSGNYLIQSEIDRYANHT